MIQKKQKVVVTFYTTTDAMDMERLCKTHPMDGRMIPVPGDITADCGLAWCSEPAQETALLALMNTAGLSCQGVYHLLV